MKKPNLDFEKLINEMKILTENEWTVNGKISEDDAHVGYNVTVCPYKKCDGSGLIKNKKDGTIKTSQCDCYKDEVLKRKLNKSKIEQKYWDSGFDLKDIEAKILIHKKNPEERKFKGKKPANPLPEEPMEYINRIYVIKEIKKGIKFFGEEFIEKTIGFLNEYPRKRVQNLLLMGEPGRGKTHLVCGIGKEYLKRGKTVHFTTMMNLVNDVLNPEVNIKKIIETVDLLIVDEMGYEYHTETQWALKQIKELFRIRYNKNLPIIATSNFYPNELNELYDKSLMSILDGSFFFVLVERENDFRINQAEDALKEFSFLDEE